MQPRDGVDILEIADGDAPVPPAQTVVAEDDTVAAATTLVDTTRASSPANERERPLMETPVSVSTRRDAPTEEHVWTSPRRSGSRAPASRRARPMSAPSTAQHRIQRPASTVVVDETTTTSDQVPQLVTVDARAPATEAATATAAPALVVDVSEPPKTTDASAPLDHSADAASMRRSSPEWIKYHTEDGDEYYYNARTHESQWTRPPGVMSPTASASVTPTSYSRSHTDLDSSSDGGGGNEPLRVSIEELFELLAQPSSDHAVATLETTLRRVPSHVIDWNARNAAGLSLLHVAVQGGNARACALLLDHGASAHIDVPLVRGDASAETPLMMACRANIAPLVRLLTRYGASTAVRDADGNTLLHLAVRCWSDDALFALLEVETVVAAALEARNAEDETPLHLAARHGNAVAVRALLAAGARADQEDAHGRTPLVVSIMENRVECAQVLQVALAPDANADSGELLQVTHEPAEARGGQEQASATETATALSASGEPELDAMQSYLLQVLETTADTTLVASAVYQYVEMAQRHVHAWRAAAKSAELKHENLRLQLDVLRKSQLLLQAENASLTEERDALAQQLDAKELERATLQTAFSGLSSRAAMLESIARTAQDKLRRERAEHVQQETFWAQTIDASLRENQALLNAVQALQPQWQSSNQTDVETAAPGGNYAYDHHLEPMHSQHQQQQQHHSTSLSPGAVSASTDSAIGADADAETETDASALHVDPTQSYETDALLYSSSAKAAAASAVSPSRVDAVWNRFFENMSRVAESGSMTTTTTTATAVSASALFDAVRKANHDRLQALLLSGASPNVRDVGERGTSLHLACELGDVDAVLLLCEFGADLETRDETGNTPLLVASAQGHDACVRFLLQSAANMAVRNDAQDSALHLAAWDGSAECVEMLLEYGASVLAVNALGLTALSNLRTRSTLRHRFDELADAHPMKRTLLLLEHAERQATMEMEKRETKMPRGGTKAKEAKPKSAQASESRESWGRWLLGSVFGARKSDPLDDDDGDEDDDEEDAQGDADANDDAGDGRLSETAEPSDDADEEENDGEGDASELYRQLTPPPEVEAALRHHAASRALSSRFTLSSSSPPPPPPPEVLDALQRRQKGSAFVDERSPRATSTRFASPATAATLHRKRLSSTTDGRKSTAATGVRARYVDTFNSSTAPP
ncbi:hypothetical protein PINS_up005085 [Pythium insidiosum]|nr:hypothetical protein PINS_up005085 [Pythium insidiosum]